MANKYPSATAAARRRAQPDYFREGNPSKRVRPRHRPRYKPGPVRPIPLGRVPKAFLRAPRMHPSQALDIAVGAYITSRLDQAGRNIAGEDYSLRPAPQGTLTPLPNGWWQELCNIGGGSILRDITTSSCGTLQNMGNPPTLQLQLTDTPADNLIGLWDKEPGSLTSGRMKVKYQRVGSTPRTVGKPGILPAARAAPGVITWPLAWPIAEPYAPAPYAPARPGEEPYSPFARPKPSPHPNPDHYTPPKVRPRRRNRPRVRPGQRVVVLPPLKVPVIRPPKTGGLADDVAVVVPGTVISKPPGRPPRVVRTDDFGGNNPPPAKTWESKPSTKIKIIGAVWMGVGSITEGLDFVQAMHDSITDPKHKLSKKASKAQVLDYMLSSMEPWGHVDVAEALQNYINMQVGDWIAAFGSDQIKDVYKMSGATTGLDRAIREHGQMISDMAEPGSEFNPVPELDIDAETGVISVSSAVGGFSVDLETLDVSFSKSKPRRR